MLIGTKVFEYILINTIGYANLFLDKVLCLNISKIRYFFKSDSFKSYGVTSLGVAFAQLISLITMPVIAKIAGVELFSIFTYWLTISMIISVLVGIKGDIYVFILAKEKLLHLNSFLNLYIFASQVTILLVCSLFYCFLSVESALISILVYFLAASVFLHDFSVQYNVRNGFFLANSKIRFLRAALFPLLSMAFYFLDSLNLQTLILSFSLSNLLPISLIKSFENPLLLNKAFEKFKKHLENVNELALKKTASVQIPIHFVKQVSSGSVIILGTFYFSSQSSEVGYFALAYKLSIAPIAIICTAVSDVFKNKLSNDTAKALSHFLKLCSYLILISVVWSFLIFFVADDAILFFMGQEWERTYHYMVTLLPYMCSLLILTPLTYAYVFTGRQNADFVWQVLNLFVILVTFFLSSDGEFIDAVFNFSLVASFMLLFSFSYCFYILSRLSR